MAHIFDKNLAELGVMLPVPAKPLANYIAVTQSDNRLVVSGQLPLVEGKPLSTGRLGAEVDTDQGIAAAKACAINILAQVRAELGGFDRVERLIRLGVFVASDSAFFDQPKVANGASDFMVAVMGDAGVHVRAAVGVAVLPMNVPVEIEAEFQITG